MITNLIHLAIAAVVCYLIFYLLSMIISGVALTAVGVIIVLAFLLYVARIFGVTL